MTKHTYARATRTTPCHSGPSTRKANGESLSTTSKPTTKPWAKPPGSKSAAIRATPAPWYPSATKPNACRNPYITDFWSMILMIIISPSLSRVLNYPEVARVTTEPTSNRLISPNITKSPNIITKSPSTITNLNRFITRRKRNLFTITNIIKIIIMRWNY